MNTIYYFSVLHSLVIADEFTGKDMEKILYYLDTSDQLPEFINKPNNMWRVRSTILFLLTFTYSFIAVVV